MSTNVPTISVTPHNHHSSSSSDSDSDSSNSHDNDMYYSKSCGESTDVEDFDSQADVSKPQSRRSSTNPLKAPAQSQHDVTDVEDYDASDSDLDAEGGDKEPVYPELKLSLEEFLEQDIQALESASNGVMERVERRSGNFLQAQNLTTSNDYLTDCEDYNTDSELENECVKSVCVDLNEAFVEQGRVNIADATANPKNSDDSDDCNEDISIASNISDLMSDVGGAIALPAQALSEDELLEISGDEEECQIAFSDSDAGDDGDSVSENDLLSNSSVAPLDVAFIPPISSGNMSAAKSTCAATSKCTTNVFFLDVEGKKDDVHTDIERLDDDDDDSYDDDEKPIPQAVVLAPGDEGDCQTDCEDVSCEDVSTAESSGRDRDLSVDLKSLPQPQREVVLLQEDKYGDTITSVMPMDEEYQFGMNSKVKEECATDSEEYSCVEDDDITEVSVAEAPLPSPNGLIESEITVSNEQMKSHISKRLEIQSNTESVTDVEEFYMDGTNVRRKKLKTRSMSKNKSKYLDVPKAPEGGTTDVEDIDLSETELPHDLKCTPKANPSINLPPNQVDKTTDVEDLTTDDLSSASEADIPAIDWKSSNLKDYDTSSTNLTIALETCAPACNSKLKKMPPLTKVRSNTPQQHQQQQTDTEDVQLPSDAEDYSACEPPTTCLSHELNEMLNASCTTVHEKCQSSFNVDAEKIHIKETIQEYIPETQIVTVESVTRQGTITYDTINDKYRNDDADQDGGDDGDDDDDDDEDDDEHSGGDDDDERNGSVIDTDSKVVKKIQINQLENVRREATVLVDRVLEESMHIVNEQQDRDHSDVRNSDATNVIGLASASAAASDGNNRQEYNSESENYAITCDVVGGVDVVKSPTIESMSGKSFDDNLSSSDDQQQQQQHPSVPQETPSQSGADMRGTKITIQTSQNKVSSLIRNVEDSMRQSDATEERNAITNRRIEHKFQKISSKVEDLDVEADKFDEQFGSVVADDEISNLQGDFSKLSWDDSLSPTTNTLADIGQNTPDNDILDIVAETCGDFLPSTEITPVPPSSATVTTETEKETTTTTTITTSGTTAVSETTDDVPKPKPRSVKASSPKTDEAQVIERDGIEEAEVSSDAETSSAPVPKPRSQIKPSESYKNLTILDEPIQDKTPQPMQQTDSVSLRSFDLTEETSHTDETSVEISVRSQHAAETTTGPTTTISDDPPTESFEPTSEMSMDGSVVGGDRKTSFYIGESSHNIIIKTTPTKLSADDDESEDPLSGINADLIAATDISLMKEFSVDSEEDNDVFKEYVTIKSTEPEIGTRIRRQSSETRNDLLEEDVIPKEMVEDGTMTVTSVTLSPITDVLPQDTEVKKTSTEQSVATVTTSTISTVVEVARPTEEDDTICEMSMESEMVVVERPKDLDLSLEKSEWETTEKEIPPPGKSKIEHSPQQHIPTVLTKESATEELVAKTLDEVQESLEAAKNELKSVLKDGKSIKESPSEFEFRSFSQTLSSSAIAEAREHDIKTGKIIEESMDLVETQDISSFIGVPEAIQQQQHIIEGLFDSSIPETLDRAAAMMHYAQSDFEDGKPDVDRDDRASLGFVSTGTDEFVEDNVPKEEHASLGFVSNETAEEFSSMEDYFQEKFAKTEIVDSREEEKDKDTIASFTEISSECTMKPFDDVVHRVKPDHVESAQNRWSVPEVEQSSSSESYYKSFERSESRPLSSDVDNLTTQCTSEYKTAAEGSSTYREATEYMSAASTLDSLSGKTISSYDSMRSFDSHSETSANLISMDSSELTETLVASSTDEADEIEHLRDLLDEDDSEESLDLEATDYAATESKIQSQSMMKRSQEMIFKPKSEDSIASKLSEEETPKEVCVESIQIEEYAKPKEVEKTWGLTYPIEDGKSEEVKDTEDILLYHGDVRRSIDESKYASSLDDGSVLSVSMSSTSNIETVVENFEDIAGSFGASSLAGIEGFGASSLPEETTFVMDMEGSGNQSPQESYGSTPPEGLPSKRGHKRTESTATSTDESKNISDKEGAVGVGEGKESGSESDTDPYETEYARQFRSPTDRKSKKKKQAAAEMDHSFEAEKRPFTPSQLVAEVIVEDIVTEELEAEACMIEDRRPSQNMLDYSNIPDITVTEDIQQKSPILEEEKDPFEEKVLYKVKTQEELHKVTDDRPIYQETKTDVKEENFQKLVQEQYKQKLADLQKAEIGDSDYDENKAPDSPDSFEIVDQPDISDDFVIIEEVAKEANEDDLGGKSIRIQPTKYESKHDEEVEKMIIKSAPADPMLGSQIFRDDLNFEFEESPPTASSGGTGSEAQEESDSGSDMAASNKRWVEMQLTDNQLRYPYELTGGVLEDIKEEDGEFEVGSSRISSFKDSFSSTPEYDVLAARRYYGRGEHDDISMSSLQEFESLEQAISLENRNRTHQGSTDSSNGSFQRRYLVRHSASGTAPGDDISVSSLKEFEGLENACIEAHLIEIKAKEEAALLSRSDESNKSNGSDRDQPADSTNVVVSKVTRTVTHTEVLTGQQSPDIEALLKQKLQECERAQTSAQITHILDTKFKSDSDRGSIDSLEMNKSLDMGSSSADDSFDISKDATKSDIDSLEVDKPQPTRAESIESTDMQQMDDLISKFGVTIGDGLTTTTTTTTTSTDADGQEHTTVTKRVVTTTTTLTGSGPSSTSLDLQLSQALPKDISADSLNQISAMEHTTTSSAGTTATYQTSAGNSQMSGSITSCASSTLMEDSTTSVSAINITSPLYSSDQQQQPQTIREADDSTHKKDEAKR